MRKHRRSCCLFSPIREQCASIILRFCRLGSRALALKLTASHFSSRVRHTKVANASTSNVASFLTGKARISTLPRHGHRAVITFNAANDEPPLVRLPHTGFVRRIRARTSLTNAPPRLLVQTALAFRLRRSSRPARLPFANRKKSLASRKPAPLLTRTARLGRRTTRTCSSSPADYGADTYTR